MEGRPGTAEKLKAPFDPDVSRLAMAPPAGMEVETPDAQQRSAIEREIAARISRFPRVAGAG
eukprot:4202153-Pyramimonas_sp.AAC.1